MSSATSFRAFISALDRAWVAAKVTVLPEAPPTLSDEKDQLQDLLTDALVERGSGFTMAGLRRFIPFLTLETILAGIDEDLPRVLRKIAQHLSVDTEIVRPGAEGWDTALAVGVRLLELNDFLSPDQQVDNMASGLRRLLVDGHRFSIGEDGIDRKSDGFITVTKHIVEKLQVAGRHDAFKFLEGFARRVHSYEFDQVLYSRNPSLTPRDASIPFGFLWQLAARASPVPTFADDPNTAMRQAIQLARDLVALIGVESYGQFWGLASATGKLDNWLAEATLHDHLFSIQQWTPFITPLFLRNFFGTEYDEDLRRKLGWGVEDVAIAAEVVLSEVPSSPGLLSASKLQKRLSEDTVSSLLIDMTHQPPSPNAEYLTPFSAPKADLMFRPLLAAMLPECVLIRSRSTFGPACCEAVAAGLRKALSESQVSKMTGDGLERTTGAILKFCGLLPTIEAKRYRTRTLDGECDLVLEDDETVILIECKAKPITRAAMAGDTSDAVLAYLEGIVASQTQALQHQFVLENDGRIVFEDNSVLERRDRKIVRLSMTLFDYGTLQDRFIFSQLATVLASSTLTATDPSNASSTRRAKKSNEILEKLRKHLAGDANLNEDFAHRIWERSLPTASLSIGQLAVLLVDRNTVGKLAEALVKPATYASGSVLKEFYWMRKQGLLSS
ncbi:hypothetical protein [Mesorhizobium sp. ES1-6]|uniref:hypothetical protein n=1 Tax=Mesorhizobium sp. ES1-6 TaxID=2876626 RepID=UPI001CD00D5D|nr:hypothetical protein [Mesorhizobium sp. ES1-6]MBZ9801176.1 hypothetical protein [Mesorhizobium sp. ES1-6]